MNANALSPALKPEDRPLKAIERDLLRLVVVEGLRPTEAIRQLRPTSKRPDVMASKLMNSPHVRAAIKRMEDEALASAGVTKSWIVNELRRIGSANLFDSEGRIKKFDKLDADTRAAIASIEVETISTEAAQLKLFDGTDLAPHIGKVERVRKLKLWDKRAALSELASIARLKQEEHLDPGRVGPGLTIVVQQGAAVSGGTAQAAPRAQLGQRVVVSLPPPSPR